MTGWNFPIVFNKNTVSLLEGEENVVKDFKLLLRSELFSFFRDPGYGSPFLYLKFRPRNKLTEDLMTDALFQAEMFIPNILVDRHSVVFSYPRPGSIDIEFKALIDERALPVTIRLTEVE